MKQTVERHRTPGTSGSVLHAAARYDRLVWFFMFGRERIFREHDL